jgi:hypothetical protein
MVPLLDPETRPAKESLEQVRQEIRGLGVASDQPSPITNCEQMSTLHGMIDQKSPPKILPFSTQYEMYLSFSETTTRRSFRQKKKNPTQRWSTASTASMMAVMNKGSLDTAQVAAGGDWASMGLEALPAGALNAKEFDLSVGEVAQSFVIAPADFVNVQG